MTLTLDDLRELRHLVDAYATAADTRDDQLFGSLFLPGATLRVHQDGTELGCFVAPDELPKATGPLDQYRATMHLVANHACRADGDDARGTTYCLGHHLRPEPQLENLLMVLRYDDHYARDGSGHWRFAERNLEILWTETHAASVTTPALG